MNSLLELKNIWAGYGNEPVLKDISIRVSRGTFLGIIGPNGAGKSTLLRVASRALPPSGGNVFFDGADLYSLNPKSAARHIAFVPQSITVNFSLTVWELVLMGRIPYLGRLESYKQKDFRIAEEALKLTDMLHLKDRDTNELSAGEKQRAIIAKALAQNPSLLFLDEPTSHLDIGHQVDILGLIKKMNQETGLTVISVFHDLNLASEYCDLLLLLHDSSVFRHGTPEDVLTYSNIEAVYKTVVVVKHNPITLKPFVFVMPK